MTPDPSLQTRIGLAQSTWPPIEQATLAGGHPAWVRVEPEGWLATWIESIDDARWIDAAIAVIDPDRTRSPLPIGKNDWRQWIDAQATRLDLDVQPGSAADFLTHCLDHHGRRPIVHSVAWLSRLRGEPVTRTDDQPPPVDWDALLRCMDWFGPSESSGASPGLWIDLDDAEDLPAIAAAVRWVVAVTSRLPAMPIAVTMRAAVAAAIRDRASGYAVALILDDAILADAILADADAIGDQESSGVGRQIPVPPRRCADVSDSVFRSDCERFLFDCFERDELLRGRFTPNHCGTFLFGSKAIEMDFACVPLRIAIELDGYYHFTDVDAYRRDRRKDWVYQQHDYLVLRFHTDTLTDDLGGILARVRDAVRLRCNTMSDVGRDDSGAIDDHR